MVPTLCSVSQCCSRCSFVLQVLRALIRFIPKLPQQAAFSLYNYIIGYIMFYVRHPREKGQDLVGQALATLWMVVHSVQGLMFKVDKCDTVNGQIIKFVANEYDKMATFHISGPCEQCRMCILPLL